MGIRIITIQQLQISRKTCTRYLHIDFLMRFTSIFLEDFWVRKLLSGLQPDKLWRIHHWTTAKLTNINALWKKLSQKAKPAREPPLWPLWAALLILFGVASRCKAFSGSNNLIRTTQGSSSTMRPRRPSLPNVLLVGMSLQPSSKTNWGGKT